MRLFNTLLFFLISACSFAQSEQPKSIVAGESFKISNSSVFEGVLHKKNGHLLGVTVDYKNRRPEEILLEVLDPKTFDSQRQEKLNLPVEKIKGEAVPEKVLLLESSVLYFETMDQKKKDNKYLHMRSFNLDGDNQKSIFLDTLKQYKSTSDVFYIFESFDEKKFCVVKTLPYENNENQLIILKTYNDTGKLLWQDKIELPYDKKNYRFTDLKYDGQNTVYFLSKQTTGQNEDFSDKKYLINNAYKVWAYNQRKRKIKEFEVQIKDKWIHSLKISLDKKSSLHIAGYYSNDRAFSVAGVFQLNIDSTFKLRSQSLKKIVGKMAPKQSQLTEKKEIKDVYLRKMLLAEDGATFLIGESYYKEVDEYYDPRTNISSYTDNYYYGTVWITCFDKNGKLKYNKKIPKHQISINDGGHLLSITAALVNNQLNIFYNDHIKNAELKAGQGDKVRDFQNPRRAVFTCISFDSMGGMSKAFAWEIPNNRVIVPDNAEQIDANTLYFVTERGRSVQILKYEP